MVPDPDNIVSNISVKGSAATTGLFALHDQLHYVIDIKVG